MGRNFFGCLAGVLALAVSAGAQQPQTPPTPAEPASLQGGEKVTVEGCVMREADVPGREPNIAERVGIGEDFILTNIRMVRGSLPFGAAEATPGSPAPKGSRTTMFEIEGIDDEELRKHIGHRVQIDGQFENVDQLRDPAEAGSPADDLAEISGTSIRRVDGSCGRAGSR